MAESGGIGETVLADVDGLGGSVVVEIVVDVAGAEDGALERVERSGVDVWLQPTAARTSSTASHLMLHSGARWDAVPVDVSTDKRAGYRRSTGSARGEARRQDLLEKITDDLAVNGLADFSLRRAARAAGTTHKVLLYHFDGPEDLLAQAMVRLRERRVANALPAMAGGATLGARIRAVWPVLMDDASGLRVIDQAIGLAMYDPDRYAHLAREASEQYRPTLRALCPSDWPEERKHEVAELILATMRGFLMEWRTSRDREAIDAGLEALVRALDREESAGP